MEGFLPRARLAERVRTAMQEAPITVLLGARQTGKTTLARTLVAEQDSVHFFDLEESAGRTAMATPELTLRDCRGLVVIDEVQRMPSLFETLRPLSDRPGEPARFLLLGSASPELVRGVSETLAGRALFVRVPGFAIDETGPGSQNRLWLRGGFPRAYLAASDDAAGRWLDSFAATFLERDIPQLGIRVPAEALRRFWTMTAHYHGQIWNAAELARSLDVSPNTVRHYLDIMCGAFVLRVLPPWFENLKKRQVKSTKLYMRDSGLLHHLLGIGSRESLWAHPRRGASWEGFALEQTLTLFGERDAYFWNTQGGAEIDLLLLRGGRRYGFEFKCSDAPSMTRSLHVALKDLGLDRTFVLYPGAKAYPIHEQVEVVPLEHLHEIAIAGREQGRGDRSGSNRSAAVRCGPIAPGAYSDPP